MPFPQNVLPELLGRFAARLRFPQLFAIVATLFLFDLFVPDLIPFVDEILLGLTTIFLGSLRRRQEDRSGPAPPPAESGEVIDVEPGK